MKDFLIKNKVLIIGLLMAVIMPVYDMVSKGETSWRMVAYAAAVGLVSFLARNLRGQWITIMGIIGTVLATYATEIQTGRPISWMQFFLQIGVMILAAVAAPPKNVEYEKNPTIQAAKEEGEWPKHKY